VSTYNPVSNKDDGAIWAVTVIYIKKASRTIKHISFVGRIILQFYAKSLRVGFI